jgi:ABC-type lipoprotein export system ATPase subunit
MNSVEALSIGKSYWDGDRTLQILKDISFNVREGEGVAIFGPSGSGKTTLLNILSGLDRPSSGSVRLDGVEIGKLSESQRAAFRSEKIGFIFQFYHLLPELTALENVLLPALVAGGAKKSGAKSRATALLERVGLGGRLGHFPSELSGGEQQRVAIARALVNDPKILFCDEPTGNLDLKMGLEIAQVLKELFARDKKTVLMVTHDERIARMSDRVWNLVDRNWGP